MSADPLMEDPLSPQTRHRADPNAGAYIDPDSPRFTKRRLLPAKSTLLLLPVLLFSSCSTMLYRPVLPNLMRKQFEHHSTNNATGHHPTCGHDGTSEAASVSSTFDSLAAVASFLSSPVVGHLSDVVGRRKVIIAMTAVGILPTLLMLCTQDLWWYFAGNVAAGFAAGMYVSL